VLWAEHTVEGALGVADTVWEIVDGHVLAAPAERWQPRTLPAPPLMALGRALGVERAAWTDPDVLRAHPGVLDALPVSGDAGHVAGDVATTVPAATARLDADVELRHGECTGVVSLAADRARELEVAGRLAAVARGGNRPERPLLLPGTVPIHRLARVWEERHDLAPGSVLTAVAPWAALDAARAPAQHSAGERAALRWAMAAVRPGARLLVDPDAGLDPHGRRLLATTLRSGQRAATLLVTRDPELLVRACHRVLVVDAEQVVADGTPAAVRSHLPALGQVAGLGGRALRVRDVVGEGS
jgi:energy-coupling factor transport system ATP-binding protein